jgi:hypothetical protein
MLKESCARMLLSGRPEPFQSLIEVGKRATWPLPPVPMGRPNVYEALDHKVVVGRQVIRATFEHRCEMLNAPLVAALDKHGVLSGPVSAALPSSTRAFCRNARGVRKSGVPRGPTSARGSCPGTTTDFGEAVGDRAPQPICCVSSTMMPSRLRT